MFQNIHSALAYYRHCKPGRLKSINLLERERHTPSIDPVTKWSILATTIWSVLKHEKNERAKKAFISYYLDDNDHNRAYTNITDIAASLGVSKTKMYKDFNKIIDALEKELSSRRMI
jgi:uncharacterized membrane protein